MATKLFLGGVSSNTSGDTVRDHFTQFGAVTDAVVMRDRGFGFVTFESPDAADAALREPNQIIDGQSIDVRPANGKNSKGGGKGGGGGGSRGDGVTTDKIFVGGLPQDCADHTIKAYFEVYGKIVDAVVMKDKETGRSRGFGFIQFDNPSPVDKVMADYDTHKIENKWVECKRSIPKDQMPDPPPDNRGGRRGGGDRDRRDSDRDRDRDRGSYGGGAPAYGMPPAMYGGGGYGAYMGGYPGYPGYGMPQGYPGYPPAAYGGYPGMPPPAYGGYPGMPPAGYGGYGAAPAPSGKGSSSRPSPY